MLSQFTRPNDSSAGRAKEPSYGNTSGGKSEHKTLADVRFNFPKDVYPVGRLDSDSEGLLLLTNDKFINLKLLDPKFKHNRTYLSQVEGVFSEEAKRKLEKGVFISVDGEKYQTLPCKVEILSSPNGGGWEGASNLAERNPPIRFRKNIPTSFIKISLHEGKNRQVRKMTASVGFPTLRLLRIAIEKIELGNLQPSEVMEMGKKIIYDKLRL